MKIDEIKNRFYSGIILSCFLTLADCQDRRSWIIDNWAICQINKSSKIWSSLFSVQTWSCSEVKSLLMLECWNWTLIIWDIACKCFFISKRCQFVLHLSKAPLELMRSCYQITFNFVIKIIKKASVTINCFS